MNVNRNFEGSPIWPDMTRHWLSSVCLLLLPLPLLAQSGSVDPGFNPGDGVDLPVYTILVQGNGQMFIGGNFYSFDNVDRINVAHLNSDGSRDDTFTPGVSDGASDSYVNV